jgi:hypothetical protein
VRGGTDRERGDHMSKGTTIQLGRKVSSSQLFHRIVATVSNNLPCFKTAKRKVLKQFSPIKKINEVIDMLITLI